MLEAEIKEGTAARKATKNERTNIAVHWKETHKEKRLTANGKSTEARSKTTMYLYLGFV